MLTDTCCWSERGNKKQNPPPHWEQNNEVLLNKSPIYKIGVQLKMLSIWMKALTVAQSKNPIKFKPLETFRFNPIMYGTFP